jgi:hypothetical protein
MDGAGILVPILVPLGAFAMVFGIVYLRTRENLAMLERGKDPRSTRPYNSLKAGLLISGSAIGLLIAYLIDMGLHRGDVEPLYFALIALGGAAGLLISSSIEKKAMEKDPDLFR